MSPTQLKNRWFVIWWKYRFAWSHLVSVVEALHQRDELQRLVKWAYRKRLKGVSEHYSRLLQDTELRLLNRAFRHPRLTNCAEFVYTASVMLSPAPRYYPKGAAAKYRLRN